MTHDELCDAVAQITGAIPFNRTLGMRLEDLSAEKVVIGFDMRPDLVGNSLRNILHGGVISAALDYAGGITALAAVMVDRNVKTSADVAREFASFGTIDLRIDYLRPGAGAAFQASGTVLRLGKRVAVTRMELHNEVGTLLAVGTGTYITA